MKASFAGVEFQIEDSQTDVGRRNTSVEFPGRDTPFTKDIGRRARKYSFNLFVNGEDFERQRDRLIAACEDNTEPQILIHPIFGSVKVRNDGLSISEESVTNKITKFAAVFIEAGDALYPQRKKGARDTEAVLERLRKVSDEGFAKEIRKNIGASEIAAIRSKFRDVTKSVRDSAKLASLAAGAVTDISYELRNLDTEIGEVLDVPEKASELLKNAVGSLVKFEPRARKRLQSLQKLIDKSPRIPVTGSEARVAEVKTAIDKKVRIESIALFSRTLYLASEGQTFDENVARIGTNESSLPEEVADKVDEMARLGLPLPVDIGGGSINKYEKFTKEDFSALIANILRSIEQEIADFKTDTESLDLLYKLEADIAEIGRAENLREVQTVRILEPTNSLILAHQMTGSTGYEGDLITLNQMVNPLLILPGEEIKVTGG